MQELEAETALESETLQAETDKKRMQQNVLLVNSLANAKVGDVTF